MSRPKILVADDEPFIARSLSYVLERNGYDVYASVRRHDDGEATVAAAVYVVEGFRTRYRGAGT